MDSGLYVVATPIGNLGDITQRALDVLRGVDLVAAEDTRHSARLLQAYDIDTPLTAYHEHSDSGALERLAQRLFEGASIALVSDAGTPLISDPGYRLVRRAQEQGIVVIPVPGPCAAVAALSAAGLPTDRFRFEGFLPAKHGARCNRLRELSRESATLVFYEAPHRVQDCLADMAEVFGEEREASLLREITKAFETVRRGTLASLLQFVAADDNQRRGEIVLVVAGLREQQSVIDSDTSDLLQRLVAEMPAKRAAALVAEWKGIRKKLLYEHLLALKHDS
ncbi:MAG: 16S rRNA (cytidine(1402)-2'-O)-methyltransferase [Halioglobus sp.]